MPELPEVETVVRGLRKHLIDQTIKGVEVLNKKSIRGLSVHKSIGLSVKSVSRRGKGIIIELAKPGVAKGEDGSSDFSLLIHLKMTGQLIWISSKILRRALLAQDDKTEKGRLNFGHPTKDFASEMPSRHTRIIFKLSKGTLYFNDQRLFGWVKVLPSSELEKDPFIKKLGPEPLATPYIFSPKCPPSHGREQKDSQELSAHLWADIKRRPQSSIKAILLDQSVITGLGNIYTDEVLFEAGIRPTRKGKSITKKDIEKILKAIKKILTKGIKYSGTSIVNYKTPDSSPGKMQNYLKVYSRAGLPCRKCRTPISKIRLAGRSVHFCPKCQK